MKKIAADRKYKIAQILKGASSSSLQQYKNDLKKVVTNLKSIVKKNKELDHKEVNRAIAVLSGVINKPVLPAINWGGVDGGVEGLSKMELKDYLKKEGYYVDQHLPYRETLIKMISKVHGISDDSKSKLRAESWARNILNRKDLSIEVAKAYKKDKPNWDEIEEPGKETRTPTKGF